MIKRLQLLILLVLSFLLVATLAAQADVLITPNNNFFDQNYSNCEFIGRCFYANGPAGSVSVKETPGAKKAVAVIKNGESILIQFTYRGNGRTWGATILGDWEKPDGWIPMEQLLLVYDYISFDEEHQDEYYSYTGDYQELFVPGDFVLWSWPGSGIEKSILKEEWREPEVYSNFLGASHAYKDSAGREWVFLGYMYGVKNTWICLSDPTNRDIPAFNPPPPPPLWQPQSADAPRDVAESVRETIWQPQNADAPANGLPLPVLIIILVAALVVVTAILIRLLWKRKI